MARQPLRLAFQPPFPLYRRPSIHSPPSSLSNLCLPRPHIITFSSSSSPPPSAPRQSQPSLHNHPNATNVSSSTPSATTSTSTNISTNNNNNATAATPPNIVLSSLSHVSYDVAGVRVISDVSLDLMQDEIVCILGPSGSGKSTILRILAGLTAPSAGAALYKSRPFRGTNPGASIVFQTFALYPWLTVLENVQLGLPADLPSKPHADPRRARAMRAIDIIGLDGYENAYPRELSGGMRQRVGFARALAVEPEFLCMDEPFSALDVLTAENLRSELLRLWQAGDVPTTSVLIVTHGIEEAVSLADRIVILGKDPGHVRTILPVCMKHPRNRKSLQFQQITELVYTLLSEKDYSVSQEDLRLLNGEVTDGASNEGEQSPVSDGRKEPKVEVEALSLSDPLRPVDLELDSDTSAETENRDRYPLLPPVRIGSVGGLLSFIAEEPADLSRLGQRLQLDVDDLYPLIDAANILGLIELDEGHVRINAEGMRFDLASIDDRKNIVRTAALNAPGSRLVAQIYRLLSEAINQKLPQELIFDTILLKHFSPLEARRQLEIAIEWGRFAELFGYESTTGTLFLDTGEDPDQILSDRE